MSSSSWQDRRFMFPAGKEIHEGSRRMSGSPATAESPTLSHPPPGADVPDHLVTEKKVLSNPNAWGGNRLFMSRSGKEIHEPARRPSGSSPTKPDVIPKSSSPPAKSGGGIAAAIAGRRRSSASSGGVFSGLMANRSSHDERIQSRQEMRKAEGTFGGLLSNLVGGKPAEEKK